MRRKLPSVEAILDGLLVDVARIAAVVLEPLRAPVAAASTEGAGACDPAHPDSLHPVKLVRHSGHSIGYGTGRMRETALRLHVDDSLLTVNVCLGNPGFTGSSILFTGAQPVCLPAVARSQARRDLLRRLAEVEVAAVPKPGWALVHLGRHPHRTLPIESGERFNWVLWFHAARTAQAVAAGAGLEASEASGAAGTREAVTGEAAPTAVDDKAGGGEAGAGGP